MIIKLYIFDLRYELNCDKNLYNKYFRLRYKNKFSVHEILKLDKTKKIFELEIDSQYQISIYTTKYEWFLYKYFLFSAYIKQSIS